MVSRAVRFQLLSAALCLANACGGTTSSATCGDGTVAKNGECVAASSSMAGATSAAGSTSLKGSTTNAAGSTSIGINTSGGAGGSGEGPGGSCVLASDCPSALVCAFNECHLTCEQDRDCPSGQRCIGDGVNNACLLATETACMYNSECPVPLVCGLDLKCRSQCVSDRDCPSGDLCSRSECFELGAGGASP